MCLVITDMCFGNIDTIESRYSETGGLSYDEAKANTWHPLVWICHECESCHPLTAADHKWSYKSEETLSLATSGVWIRLLLPTKPSLSHVTSWQGSGQFDTWRRQSCHPRKCWVEQVTSSTGLSPADAWNVATDQSASRVLRPVDGQVQREKGHSSSKNYIIICNKNESVLSLDVDICNKSKRSHTQLIQSWHATWQTSNRFTICIIYVCICGVQQFHCNFEWSVGPVYVFVSEVLTCGFCFQEFSCLLWCWVLLPNLVHLASTAAVRLACIYLYRLYISLLYLIILYYFSLSIYCFLCVFVCHVH